MLTKAREGDAGRIAELHIASWRATYSRELSQAFLGGQDVAVWSAEWRRQLAEGVEVMLATEDDELVGFVACGPVRGGASDPVEWEIYNLHVAPARQGEGLGRKLFNAAAELGRGRGARQLVLWVVRTNDSARAFYGTRGMRFDGGAQEHVLGDERLHEVRYRMNLGAGPRPDDELEWRNLALSDIPGLATFAPEKWQMALDAVLLQHAGRDYFHAWVASTARGIVAVGHGIATGRTGWVGNIIVRPDARNRGLGTRITQEVMASLRDRGCSTTILIATALGEPIYRAIGFRRTAEYVFLDVPRLSPFAPAAIRRLDSQDTGRVLGLDATATGERRADLLGPHLGSGWGHMNEGGSIDGFFLPSFGAGPVIAETPAAGLALLRFKHAFFPGAAVVPAGNAAALAFLLANGASETARAPRMVLGEEADWRPEWIFARAAGYCG